MILGEIGSSVAVADLMHKPAAPVDDRLVKA
jgi:hypothetical protein